jgi:adenylate cyclase class 2
VAERATGELTFSHRAGLFVTARTESSGPRRNLELKAWDPSPEQSLQACRSLGAEDRGLLWQRDTYFNVPRGRLKLREQRPGHPQLIAYDRPDQPQQRESRYRVAEVADGAATRDLLTASLGVRCSVTKRRRLFLWRGVRIHLDEVTSLGAFIELEAVARPGSDLSHEHALVRELRRLLSIPDERLVPDSYADQLARSAMEHPS